MQERLLRGSGECGAHWGTARTELYFQLCESWWECWSPKKIWEKGWFWDLLVVPHLWRPVSLANAPNGMGKGWILYTSWKLELCHRPISPTPEQLSQSNGVTKNQETDGQKTPDVSPFFYPQSDRCNPFSAGWMPWYTINPFISISVSISISDFISIVPGFTTTTLSECIAQSQATEYQVLHKVYIRMLNILWT